MWYVCFHARKSHGLKICVNAAHIRKKRPIHGQRMIPPLRRADWKREDPVMRVVIWLAQSPGEYYPMNESDLHVGSKQGMYK